ncbi:hypothetical protein BSL78_17594 [Apostichopus japonicus]|uniref:Immunoglobulin domain-containing protein n=1 Tax=Stichopus japonicus TaxID=307972 RepID=A0A2G8KC54_STIJA|nr:hypothetical protein BSL78_17594 [Apostichopus japonicus]
MVTQLLYLPLSRGDSCPPNEYLEIGQKGYIGCFFEDGFTLVAWYNTDNFIQANAVVKLRGEDKSGIGWDSKEFDIRLNGSLIINEVDFQHESIFTVRVYRKTQEFPTTFYIDVKTTVTPKQPYPVIYDCDVPSEICHTVSNEDSQLMCGVLDSRPAVPVIWTARTSDGDKDITSSYYNTSHGLISNYTVSSMNPFAYSSLLVLLVCQSNDRLMMLKRTESFVLVENEEIDLSTHHHNEIIAERGKQVELLCSNYSLAFLLWKKVPSNDIVLYGTFINTTITKVFETGVTLGSKGSVVIESVDIRNEGLYACIYNDWRSDGIQLTSLSVIVYPEPSYLKVERCNHETYCTLQVQRTGSLTCQVKGIRPVVKLKWRVVQDKFADLLTFTSQENSVTKNGDTADVILVTKFEALETTPERLAVECLATGQHAHLFRLTTTLDLVIIQGEVHITDEPVVETKGPSVVTVVIAVLSIGTILSIATVYVVYTVCRRRRITQNAEYIDDEDLPMLKRLPHSDITDKKKLFITQLKGSYENLFNSIKPVPYLEERYAVNSLFVEGGMECLVQDNSISWQRLESYKCIQSDCRVKSTRRIIEAEPGYGKSTLTLQLAYEWCGGVQESILKNVDIFILVKLRQLKGVSSIYDAIKKFVLPRDSRLVTDDIKEILNSCSPEKVFVILDGFDEFPENEKNSISDVLYIIKRRMFVDFEVVLTTRSFCLPKEYAPQTKRIRLTGFDKTAQEKYLQKAVTKDDESASVRVKEALKDNPILIDLCQVPLFFVMFAHLSRDNEQLRKCTSVTKFFRYIISSLYKHFKRKMEDQNVDNVNAFENDHDELDKLAFSSLTKNTGQTDWSKDELNELLGSEFLDQFLSVGILREYENTTVIDDPGTLNTKKVRFYHPLFCEWYAAHYVADIVAKHANSKVNSDTFPEILESLEPNKFHYIYRFACGISQTAAKTIIPYLQDMKGRDRFAMLCILEQSGKVDDIIDNVKNLCTREIHISYQDSRLLQRSIVQIMVIASTRNIPIASLWLEDCFHDVHISHEEIVLKSTISLPVMKCLKELCIDEREIEMNQEEIDKIFDYANKCSSLQTLKFRYCLLPQSIEKGKPFQGLSDREVNVLWYPQLTWYQLDFTYGTWKYKDSDFLLDQLGYDKEADSIREMKTSLANGKQSEEGM